MHLHTLISNEEMPVLFCLKDKFAMDFMVQRREIYCDGLRLFIPSFSFFV